MQTFVIYSGEDEVIVTTPEQEKVTIAEYFNETGRDINYWDRTEVTSSAVLVTHGTMKIEF